MKFYVQRRSTSDNRVQRSFVIKPTIGLEIKNNFNVNNTKKVKKEKKSHKNFEFISSKIFLNTHQIKNILKKLN